MSRFQQEVVVNCCYPDDTIDLATCGRGVSCSTGLYHIYTFHCPDIRYKIYVCCIMSQVSCGASCSSLGARLCPSGDCSGDCRIHFGQGTNENTRRRLSNAGVVVESWFQLEKGTSGRDYLYGPKMKTWPKANGVGGLSSYPKYLFLDHITSSYINLRISTKFLQLQITSKYKPHSWPTSCFKNFNLLTFSFEISA